MADAWYKEYCPKCETVNWVCNGDESDLSGVDIEGIRCRECGKIFFIGDFNEDEYLNMCNAETIEDINWKLGLETPD